MSRTRADGPTTTRPPRIIRWRLVVTAVLLGACLALLSVPAAALIRPWAINRPWLAKADAYWIEGENDIAITVLDEPTPGYRWWFFLDVNEDRASEFPHLARTGPEAHLRADPRPAKIRNKSDRTAILHEYVAAGWPWPCACGRGPGGIDPGWPRSEGGLLRVGQWTSNIPIPLRPLWGGFLANTAFFAALTMGVVVLARWLRRHHRRNHNRCLYCGYDLRGGPGRCPECGTLAAFAADRKP